MDSQPVNWETLDSLVIDFAESENLIENTTICSSPSPPQSFRLRHLIRQIRWALEIGDIDSVIDMLQVHAPDVLNDRRLLFRLQKQKFIELLRKGTDASRDLAIECLRTSLAPCALDAYPEAYEEFKHVLLAFVFDKEDQSSPVANEWSEKRRTDIAGLLCSVLRAHLHAYDPIFSMTLRYLVSIHKVFCFRQGISSPIADLTERLLLEDRDNPAAPQESLYEAPPFDEVDVQALAHAVEITRQSAIDSLRYAKGDLFQAFQNELCRMKLDEDLLDELVQEYCFYRGIVDGDLPSATEDGQYASVDSSNIEVNSIEQRTSCEVSDQVEDCSTSEIHYLGHRYRRFEKKSYTNIERKRCKRWKGRIEMADTVPDIIFVGNGNKKSIIPLLNMNGDSSEEEKVSVKNSSIGGINQKINDKYGIILEIKELASNGMVKEVVEEVNAIRPTFFSQNPVFLFQLKQVEFLKLVKCGDFHGALRVASSFLGPLAENDPSLLKSLKETLLCFLRPEDDPLARGTPLCVLAATLQVAIGRSLGIEEPRLMKIMRATLYTHSEWFKLQMCSDRFDGFLKIYCLKEIDPSLDIGLSSKSTTDSFSHGSSKFSMSTSMQEDGNSPNQASSIEISCDEAAILKVMEFLALPRADAIHLLRQYNGNAETVIQQIFA